MDARSNSAPVFQTNAAINQPNVIIDTRSPQPPLELRLRWSAINARQSS